MGRGTGPWGRCSVAARAFVTFDRCQTTYQSCFVFHTEHLPSSSNLSAEGIDAMMCRLFEYHHPETRLTKMFALKLQGSG